MIAAFLLALVLWGAEKANEPVCERGPLIADDRAFCAAKARASGGGL